VLQSLTSRGVVQDRSRVVKVHVQSQVCRVVVVASRKCRGVMATQQPDGMAPQQSFHGLCCSDGAFLVL
jgi:hypothetical protein